MPRELPELSPAELDGVLERFDQTDPATQRQTIARLLAMVAILGEQNVKLLAACQAVATADSNEMAEEACRLVAVALAAVEGE